MIAVTMAATLACFGQVESLTLDGAVVSADRLLYSQADGVVYAEGHVLFETDEAWLTCAHATYYEADARAECTGRITISAPDRFVRGTGATYYFRENRGQVNEVSGWDESAGVRLFVEGSTLTFEDMNWTLTDAYVRTSEKSDASYKMWADELRYIEGHSWEGKNVKVEIFGVRVFSVSDYQQRVGDPTLTSLQWVPIPGMDPQDGLFLEWAFDRNVLGDLRVGLRGRLSTRGGISGSASVSRDFGDAGSLWGHAGYREAVGDITRPYLRWSHLTGGVSWRLVEGGPWRVDASTSYGQINELPSKAKSRRGALTLDAVSRAYELDDRTKATFHAGIHGYSYSTGQRYAFARAGVLVDHEFGRDMRLWGGITGHMIGGSTPFETDTVDIPLELRLGGRVRFTDHWAAEADVRYDLEDAEVRHTELGIRYRGADFVYRARYNVERKYFSFDLLLPD